MYHQKNVDYVYLPFEEDILAFIRELGYPGDIKSLFDVKVDTLYQPWRTFGTIINKCLSDSINFVSLGLKSFRYDAIIPNTLTNQAMKESDVYKTYHDFATRKVIPKPKYVWRSTREKTDQAPIASLGKRLKATTKMNIVTTRSKTQFHSSHAGGSGENEGTGVSLRVPDVLTYGFENEQISWKSSDEDDDDEVSLSKDNDDNANNEDDDGQDDDNEQTKSDNDGDDFVHPKFSTHDEEE
ncbi:hypothetical protein Tco_1343027 [Tanacetum coccineum]